jgi:coenzyme F420-0:L-glutamate ligase/coenzyme F420-1:gamma-L-glutamate ligase
MAAICGKWEPGRRGYSDKRGLMQQAAQAFYDLVNQRRSIRHFKPGRLARPQIERMLQAACQAPSAHNRQPWRFVLLEPGERREKLAQAMAERFRLDLQQDGIDPREIEARIERGRDRLVLPPLVVILCLTMQAMDSYPDARRQAAERLMAGQSLALAGGHWLLAAQAEGLGACWLCAPLFASDVVRRVLGLPDDWEAQGMLIIGEPDESGRSRSRLPPDQVSLWR